MAGAKISVSPKGKIKLIGIGKYQIEIAGIKVKGKYGWHIIDAANSLESAIAKAGKLRSRRVRIRRYFRHRGLLLPGSWKTVWQRP